MLRFSLFGIPIRVRSSFLIVAALIGFVGVFDAARTIAWMAIVFVSILVHELGHAFTARGFGSQVAIELNGLGGLTRWSAQGGMEPGRRAVIAAAGSAAGLVFGGLVWVVSQQFGPYETLVQFVFDNLVFVNVLWGLLNWLPIRPLDGGHLLESLLEKIAPQRAETIARLVFTLTAGVALAVTIRFQLIFIAVLAGWLLLSELTYTRPGLEETRQPPPRGIPMLTYDDPSETDAPADPDPPHPDESDETTG